MQVRRARAGRAARAASCGCLPLLPGSLRPPPPPSLSPPPSTAPTCLPPSLPTHNCSLAVEAAADQVPGVEQYAMRAFADALDIVPLSLAENSGLAPIESLTEAS